jgi:hypothetical protein
MHADQYVLIIQTQYCDAERIGIDRGTKWKRLAKLEKQGTSSFLDTKVIDDKPVFDKEITSQTIATGRFYLHRNP